MRLILRIMMVILAVNAEAAFAAGDKWCNNPSSRPTRLAYWSNLPAQWNAVASGWAVCL